MPHLNVEIKARCSDLAGATKILQRLGARRDGTFHQVDTYFNAASGKLKLRESETESTLIFYEREQTAGPKKSTVTLYPIDDPINFKELMSAAVGVGLVVEKQREIYWIKNVKFHLDTVPALGTFIEFEAIDYENLIGEPALYEQCQKYLRLFGVADNDLVTESYSDLLVKI